MRIHAFAFRPGRTAILAALVSAPLVAALLAAPPSATPGARRIATKLDSTIISSIAFDETTFPEAVDFLHRELMEGDDAEKPAASKGVDFVDLRAGDPDKTISLTLEKVPAREALKYMCLLGNCQYAIEQEAIVITDEGSRRNPGGDAGRPSDGSPQSRLVEKFLASEVLESIQLDGAELEEAIEFLRLNLKDASERRNGAPMVNFVIADPALAKTPVSLGVRSMTVRGALAYLMEKAGAEFTIEKGIVTIRKWETSEKGKGRKRVVLPPGEGEPVLD